MNRLICNAHYLARATPPSPVGDFPSHCFWSLGYPMAELPTGRFYGGAHRRTVLATPVFCESTPHEAFLRGQAGCDPTLLPLLAPFFEEVGIILHGSCDGHWRLECIDWPLLFAPPPAFLRGKPLSTWLTALDTTHCWQKLFTETQMLLATHHQPFQALWFWGDSAHYAEKENPLPVFVDTPRLHACFPNAKPFEGFSRRKAQYFFQQWTQKKHPISGEYCFNDVHIFRHPWWSWRSWLT